MATYRRLSESTSFPAKDSRLRLGMAMAEAWGIAPDQPFECIGFFRHEDELWCIPADRVRRNGASPLARLLALEAPTEDAEDIPALEELPSTREVVGPDRLIRFEVTWPQSLQSRRFDLALGAEAAKRLGKSPENMDVQVISLRGWLVIMMKARYEMAWKEAWD